jgi:HSP20 family protein
MAVIRFDPFRDPLERLLSMAATGTRGPARHARGRQRAGDGSYHVEADLPGADLDSVEVTVEHSTLTIRAERTPHYGDSEQLIVAERPQGRSPASCPSARAWTRKTSPPTTPTVSCT